MLLPEEIENQQFEVSFRGYNTREVDEFLNKMRTDAEEMLAELETFKRRVAAAELLAKDAKDHEEDFIASMKADRDSADVVLSNAKTEGERIIREAKNAASGIMAEVRRRAGDISSESRRASAGMIEDARRRGEEIISRAEAEAEEQIYSARTEADNILRAAETEANALVADAKRRSVEITREASEAAAACEEYMKEIRNSADLLCRELDAELKNSAARITLLGRRIASVNISANPAADVAIESEEHAAAPAEESSPRYAVSEEPAIIEETPAVAAQPVIEEEPSPAEHEGGYFTEEYQQAMDELFGNDKLFPSSYEDDDTYDYLDKVKVVKRSPKRIEVEDDDTNGEIGDPDTVTSEYSGLHSIGFGDDHSDLFGAESVDRVYKSPSSEDINDILNS